MPSLINDYLLDEIKTELEGSASALLIDPASLKAEESLAFRRKLHGIGARLKVSRARLVRLAVPEEVRPHLEGGGSVGLITCPDIAAAAKVVNDLAKADKIKVRAGIVEGRALDGDAAKRLADLPSKPELQARLLGTLQAPMANFVRLLNEVPTAFARVLDAYRRQQGG
jgi:large subunit ribosomal protein L10